VHAACDNTSVEVCEPLSHCTGRAGKSPLAAALSKVPAWPYTALGLWSKQAQQGSLPKENINLSLDIHVVDQSNQLLHGNHLK